ncbi:MAG: site-2 protease family protein [bacterium]|nr:site-2 protease family protein [bacterium]
MENKGTSGAADRSARVRRAWSVYIGTIAGIPIYLHLTFILMIAFLALTDLFTREKLLGGVLLILCVFASVALHELGHALMARRFGIATDDIVLYPIGGIARLRSMGEGFQEFWISVAGPVVNILIAASLFAWLFFTRSWVDPTIAFNTPSDHFVQALMQMNIVLVLFNIIPAFPMDGGRVLRAILAQAMPKETATNIAARIGQGLAIAFMLLGFLGAGNVLLMFIGLFVFLAAGQEAAATRSAALLTGRKVRDAMITHFEVLAHSDTLGKAADLLLSASQQDFPVMNGSEVTGILSRRALIQGLSTYGRDHYVAEIMAREYPRLSPGDDLQRVFEILHNPEGLPILVFDHDHFIGFINNENLMEYILIAGAHHPGGGNHG